MGNESRAARESQAGLLRGGSPREERQSGTVDEGMAGPKNKRNEKNVDDQERVATMHGHGQRERGRQKGEEREEDKQTGERLSEAEEATVERREETQQRTS